jgi:hypothetical protein
MFLFTAADGPLDILRATNAGQNNRLGRPLTAYHCQWRKTWADTAFWNDCSMAVVCMHALIRRFCYEYDPQ